MKRCELQNIQITIRACLAKGETIRECERKLRQLCTRLEQTNEALRMMREAYAAAGVAA